VPNRSGILYVVATPIGNLEDLSPRALRVLKESGLIAVEDTRHSRHLFDHFQIATALLPYHDFNERDTEKILIERLLAGTDVALICDAGTPLINDPGYRLVKSAHEHGIKVAPVPGPSAITTALSAAGVPTDKFVFEGYPAEKHAARLKYLQGLKYERRTMVFYEAPHRIVEFLKDALDVFGPDRQGSIARELTKKFESIKTSSIQNLYNWIQEDKNHQKGEFVVLVQGASREESETDIDAGRMLELLLEELPLNTAAKIASRITGISRNTLYQLGLKLQNK